MNTWDSPRASNGPELAADTSPRWHSHSRHTPAWRSHPISRSQAPADADVGDGQQGSIGSMLEVPLMSAVAGDGVTAGLAAWGTSLHDHVYFFITCT